MKVIVLMPCLDDAQTAAELISEVNIELVKAGFEGSFLLVDDGSHPPLTESLAALFPTLPSNVNVLRLNRNLGHQRAIACGLCHIVIHEHDMAAVVIMDSDGEDRPEDIPRLLDSLRLNEMPPRVIFAERKRRAEGLVFRLGYWFYLRLHFLLIGQAPRVGNFSAISSAILPILTTDSDLWSHYAATVWKSRILCEKVATARGKRRRGRSKLNLDSLILHGLAAISCYRETLVLRALWGSGILLILASAAFVYALVDDSFAGSNGIRPLAIGISLFTFIALQFAMLTLWQVFNVMQNRHQATFIPVRDYVYFVPDQGVS